MRMLKSAVDIDIFERGSDAMREAVDLVHAWIYTFYKDSTKNDSPRAYRKALEALVAVIEKNNTSDQRKAIILVKNMLTVLTRGNAEILQIVFEENDNETNDSRVIFTTHSFCPL